MCAYAQIAGFNEVMGYSFALPTPPLQSTQSSWFRALPELIIPEQIVSHASVDITGPGEIAVMDMEDALDESVAAEFPDGVTRIMWHSHVYGVAALSSQDRRTQHLYSAWNYMMFVVINHFGHASGNFELYKPIRVGGPMNLWVAREVPGMAEIPVVIAAKCTVAKKPTTTKELHHEG